MTVRRLALLLLALVCGPASAFVDLRSEYGANQTMIRVNSVGSGATSTGRVVSASASIAGPGGQQVATRVAVQMSTRAIAVAAARVIPVIAVGMALHDIVKDMRIQDTPSGMKWDPGIPKESLGSWGCSFLGVNSPISYGSGSAACDEHVRQFDNIVGTAGCYDQISTFRAAGPLGPYTERIVKTMSFQARPGWVGPCTTPGVATQEMIASYIDGGVGMRCRYGAASGSAYDGLCQSTEGGGGTVDVQPPAFGDMVMNHPGVNGVDWPGVLGDVVANATDSNPIPTEGEPSKTEGPLPQPIPGPVVRTENPDGTVTEVATEWRLSHAADFLNPGLAQWDKKTTTTTKDQNGNTTSVSVKTEQRPIGSTSDETKDTCSVNPKSVGCQELGEVPDEPLQTRTIDLAQVAPETGWNGGACPAGSTISLGSGVALEWDTSLLCNGLAMMKPIVVASALFAAALVILGGVKS